MLTKDNKSFSYRNAHAASDEDGIITTIKNNPGIILERMARLATSTTTWFLVQRVDLMPYFQRLDQIKVSLNNISLACNEINCTHVQMIKEMGVQVIEAKNNVERVIDLLKSHEEGPTRVKRGLLNFIGALERILFGTVDAWTEAELRELIDVSANDTKKLSNLLANQTELICTEFGRFREKDDELRKEIDSLTTTLDMEMRSNKLARAIALIADNIMQFELDTTVLTDSVLFASQGALHSRFVSPNQIEQSAELVEKRIPDAIFPTLVTGGNIANLVKASDLQIVLKNGMLIYQLAIPLLDYAQFTLHRAIPLPVRQHSLNDSSTFAYIWPENRFVAIGQARDT